MRAELEFEDPREMARRERAERILGGKRRPQTAMAVQWNEQAYQEATAIAEAPTGGVEAPRANDHPNPKET